MLESQSKAQKTQILAKFPIKILAKYSLLWLGPGSNNMSQNSQKPTPLVMLPTKNLEPKTNNFFSLQTRRLATYFEGLNSSLTQLIGELWSCRMA